MVDQLRRLAYFLSVTTALLLTGLFVFDELQKLPQEQQEKLLEGKTVWTWDSPYGPLPTHYIEAGTGSRHLLLIHGFRANTYTWHHLITPLATAGYHVWAIDLVGYGLSAKPGHLPYGIDFFTSQLKAFMEAHHIQKADLVGNSMGGALALNLASLDPHYIHSLVLINPLAYPIDIPLYISTTKNFQPIWIPFLTPSVIRLSLNYIVFDPKTITDGQVEAYSLPYKLHGGSTSALLTLRNYNNAQILKIAEAYPFIKNPILLIWGKEDRLLPLSHYTHFCQDFPFAHTFLIPFCGHIPQEEHPTLVVETILKFLRAID